MSRIIVTRLAIAACLVPLASTLPVVAETAVRWGGMPQHRPRSHLRLPNGQLKISSMGPGMRGGETLQKLSVRDRILGCFFVGLAVYMLSVLMRIEEFLGRGGPYYRIAYEQIDDRMPRWPELSPGGILRAGDYLGTFICALTATLAASERGMDFFGCLIMGTVTSCGGGTIRDWMLSHENGVPKRSFWMGEPEYLVIVFLTSLSTFCFWNPVAKHLKINSDMAWEFWLDSLGMGSFCCIGTMNGIRAGVPFPIVALCGLFSSTFGGLTRDVLSRHPVRIMHAHKDMYAIPPIMGSLAYQTVRALGYSLKYRIFAGVATTVALRYCAYNYGWRMHTLNPVYQYKSPVYGTLSPVYQYKI